MTLKAMIRFPTTLLALASVPAVLLGGTIEGKVLLKGPPPALSTLEVSKDFEACGTKEVPDPRLVVDADGGLRWTILEVRGVPGETAPGASDDLPNLLQKGCIFQPHVLLVPQGVQVEITNEDGILHNVHTHSEKNLPLNRAQPKFLKVMKIGPFEPERIKVRCDVHEWMYAWIQVVEHPYYAVSGEGGVFRIENVPPGSYRITAWHENLGEKEVQVQVAEGETATVEVVFSP